MEDSIMGRPLKFRTKEELEGKIADYRKYIDETGKPMTMERLACFLGCSCETLRHYGKNKENFSATIKGIRDEIAADKLERLNSGKGSPAGIIFDLKNNHGMKDKIDQTIEHKGNVDLGGVFNDLKN